MPTKKEQKEYSSSRILDAALDEFSQKGYSGTTLANIASKANISKGLVLQRFISKDGLFIAVFDEYFKRYTPEIRSDMSLKSFSYSIIKAVKNMAMTDVRSFNFGCTLYSSVNEVPNECRVALRKYFNDSGMGDKIKAKMDEGILAAIDPFDAYNMFIKCLHTVTKSFVDCSLPLPDDEKYVAMFHDWGVVKDIPVQEDVSHRNSPDHLSDSDISSALFKDMKILLIGGHDILGKTVREVLEIEGAVVSEAGSWSEALDEVKHGILYDVIVLDTDISDDNGIEAIRMIREFEEEHGVYTSVICLCSDIYGEQSKLSLEIGADACISKPLTIAEFAKAMISCLRNYSVKIEKKLAETMRMASTDILTGVKNVVAYTDKVAELTSALKENPELSFGIIVCDLNDLKLVNDSFGHDMGNVYLKNCSRILTGVFRYSPVYRIGGDEFVVILEDHDYDISNLLIKELDERIEHASKLSSVRLGKASFAFGLSVYDPKHDRTVNDVFKRADQAMYEKKALMKKVGLS